MSLKHHDNRIKVYEVVRFWANRYNVLDEIDVIKIETIEDLLNTKL